MQLGLRRIRRISIVRQTVLTFRNTKYASLFYDYCIPLNVYFEELKFLIDTNAFEKLERNPSSYSQYPVIDLLPPNLRGKETVSRLLDISAWRVAMGFFTTSKGDDIDWSLLDALGIKRSMPIQSPKKLIYDFVHDFNLQKVDVISNASEVGLVEQNSQDPLISLTSVPIIDTSRIGWKKIEEFRKDQDAKKSLRQFRNFIRTDYSGQSASFIEDSILAGIDRYEATIKEWDFHTYNGSLNSILTSKTLAGTMSASFLSTMFGAPLHAILAASGGLSVELGKFALSYQKRKFELRKTLAENPISYIVKAKDKLDEASSDDKI